MRRRFEPRPKTPQEALLVSNHAWNIPWRRVRIPQVFVVAEGLELIVLAQEKTEWHKWGQLVCKPPY